MDIFIIKIPIICVNTYFSKILFASLVVNIGKAITIIERIKAYHLYAISYHYARKAIATGERTFTYFSYAISYHYAR